VSQSRLMDSAVEPKPAQDLHTANAAPNGDGVA
jgi:hypothetical protein